MATMTFTVEDVHLVSGWTIKITQGSGSTPSSYSTTRPTLDTTTRTFSFAALPNGSIINSAKISCTRQGNENGASRKIDGISDSVSSTSDITIATNRISAGGTLEIAFEFRSNGGGASAGYHTSGTYWKNIVLTVDYTGYTACTAPTTVSINNSSATPSQTRTLSWSGAQAGLNNAISKYEVYRSTTASGTYTKLGETNAATRSMAVTAPSAAGSYFYKVKTIGAVSGYSSGLSSAYASVSVSITAPSVPSNLTLTPASQYPTGTSVLSWTASAGTSNPITGYKVYKATSANGTYSLLATVSTNSYSITVPQSGTTYYKVMTVGTYLDSGLSSYVTLTVDMSGTSTFTLPTTVEAGAELVVTFTSNTNKAHTTVISIGNYSHSVSTAANVATASYTIPLTWLNAIPNSRTGTMTVKVTTSGAGTLTQTTSLRAPASTAPTGVNGTVAPSSTTVPAAWGVYVATLSAAAITINTAATAQYGATIDHYMIDGPGVHFEGYTLPLTATSGKLTKGNQTITLSAVDSRGVIGTKQIIINVLSYEAPTLKNILSLRTDSLGEEDDEGRYVLAKATIQWVSLQGENTASCAVSYRKQGASTWTSAGNLSNGQKLFGGGNITPADNWEIRYIVTDTLGSSNTYYDIVTRAVWEFHVKKGGGAWAFGGVANEDGVLKVYGQIAAALGNVPTAVCDIDEDLNNAVEPGLYKYEANYSNIPVSSGGGLLVIKASWSLYQIAFCNSSAQQVHIWARTKYYNLDTWSGWARVAVNNMPSSLTINGQINASLGSVPADVCDIDEDLNNAVMPGLYQYVNGYSNTPGAAGGALLVVRYNQNYIWQLAFQNNSSGNALGYIRIYSNGTWGDWQQFASQYGYPYRRSTVLNTTYNNTTANAWVNTGLTANLTAGHIYAIYSGFAYSRLMGVQLRRSGNTYAEFEYNSDGTGDRLTCAPMFFCAATQTVQLWVKRNATGQETYIIYDIGTTTT